MLHIQALVRQTALIRPEVALTLTHNRQTMLRVAAAHTPAQVVQRVARVCGENFMRTAHAVDSAAGDLRLRGWLAPASEVRNLGDLQYWFVNGRPVRDQNLQHGLRVAYGEALATGRHAAFVLALDADPSAVDINVHPAKTEVRFREPRQVHDFVLSVVRAALASVGGRSLVRPARPDDCDSVAGRPISGDAEQPFAGPTALLPEASAPVPVSGWSPARALACVGQRFLLVACGDAVRLVDLQQARERVLRHRFAGSQGGVPQPLLFPCRVELRGGRLPGWPALLAQSGFICHSDDEGGSSGVVTHVPAALKDVDVRTLLDVLLHGDALPVTLATEFRDLVIRAAACLAVAETAERTLRAWLGWLAEGVPGLAGCWQMLTDADLQALWSRRTG